MFLFTDCVGKVSARSLCINEELVTSTSIQIGVFIGRKRVNTYVNIIGFTVLLTVCRQWMIFLILTLNYCTSLKVYSV